MANLDVYQYIQEDGFLNQFLTKIETKENLTDLCKNVMSVSEVMDKLSAGIILLDKALLQQVLDKNEVLMSQLDWIDKLSSILKHMTNRIQSLVQWVEQIKPKIVKPYHRLEQQTILLSRLHETCDLLRRALRIQQLAKRLPEQDPLKAAITIAELEELSHDVDLSELEILEQENRLVKTERVRVSKQASAVLSQGLTQLNQNMVSGGLEVLKRLGLVESEIQRIMEDRLDQVEESVRYALDSSNLVPSNRGREARVSGSIPGNINNFRSKLWSAWQHALTTAVLPTCSQMMLIENVLNNKVYGSASLNLSYMNDKCEIASLYWTSVDSMLTKHLDQAAQGSSYIKQALEIEYPKLLKLHLDLHQQLKLLETDNETSVFPPMGNCVKLFEKSYLNRSLKLLLDCVKDLFPEPDSISVQPLPAPDKLDSLVKIITSELAVSLIDDSLSKPIATNVSKAVSLFCQKCQKLIAAGPDAVQFIDAPTESQHLNVSIANTLAYMNEQIRLINLPLDKACVNIIYASLDQTNQLTQAIVDPFLQSISKAIQSIILTMHNEDFNMKENGSTSSLYLRELKDFINRVVKTYLSQYHNQQIVTNMCLKVAHRCVELFIRHATLIRPISDYGRKKLVSDFKVIEEVVSPLCGRLTELGPCYSKLRSVRPLIISNAEDIASSPVLGHVIPHSLALTMLFSWHSPTDLLSPHQSMNWSVLELSDWLDRVESEEDRLEFLSGAMQKYEHTVVRSNQTPHPTYLIMKRLLEKANTHLSAHIK